MKITESKFYRDKCYINGEWITSDSGETISVNNPATLEEIGTVPKCETAVSHLGTVPISSKVAGLLTEIVSPESDVIHSPLI